VSSIAVMIVYGLMGEITSAMAKAISTSKADKLLLPIQRGNIQLVGVPRSPLPHQIEALVNEVEERLKVSSFGYKL
jgi:hypothetical protein